MLQFHNVGLFSKPNQFSTVQLSSACRVNETLVYNALVKSNSVTDYTHCS
jgi:hypothetical protein